MKAKGSSSEEERIGMNYTLEMSDEEKIPPQIVVTEEMLIEIRGAMAEIAPAQMAIVSRLTVVERVANGFSMSNSVRRASAHRLMQLDPSLDQAEANRRALAEYYALEEALHGKLETRLQAGGSRTAPTIKKLR